MKNLMKTLILAAAVIFWVPTLRAQTQLTTTTFSAAVTAPFPASAGPPQTCVSLTATTGLTGRTLNGFTSWIFADKELMGVVNVPASGCVPVIRSIGGFTSDHTTTAVVYLIPSQAALLRQENGGSPPQGRCAAANYAYLPLIHVPTGNVIDCLTLPGDSDTSFVSRAAGSPVFAATDGYFFLPPTACNSSVSGNSTGTNGFTVAGASNLPVVQAQTSNTGTNTHTFTCTIALPARLTVLKGVAVTDVTFMYGVQTTGLGTQVNVLASGTLNGQLVFSKIAMPAAGASETASTVTPVRADSGTLVITPVVASFNVATTTAGAFYSAKFAPASPIPIQTDLTELIFSVALLNTATSATITNSPGLIVHYTAAPL